MLQSHIMFFFVQSNTWLTKKISEQVQIRSATVKFIRCNVSLNVTFWDKFLNFYRNVYVVQVQSLPTFVWLPFFYINTGNIINVHENKEKSQGYVWRPILPAVTYKQRSLCLKVYATHIVCLCLYKQK